MYVVFTRAIEHLHIYYIDSENHIVLKAKNQKNVEWRVVL